ncbi:MAG: RagB/SusD family nutrient uptake outer membrane protein, partial [Bacteroidales bacterium]|nr:RagB/SusD family nutrient uptake outer membrane protein [Bacteroidales bacterium]
MMKKIMTLICCLGIFAASCDDFLDRNPFTSISNERAIIDAVTANHSLLGLYDRLQTEARYGRMIFVTADAATENVILAPTTASRFLAVAQWTTTISSGEPTTSIFAACYVIIYAANEILARVDNIDGTDAEKQKIKGEALALRGLMHFELVRLFSQAYAGNENDPLGIAYKTNPDIYELPARETLRTTYDMIIDDLLSACSLLTPANTAGHAPYRIDHWSAKAILARVYMAQLDYAKARPLLADIINNSGYTILSNGNYRESWGKRYNAASKTEYMFAIANMSDDYGNTASLGYIYLPNGYSDLRVPTDFFAMYDEDDVRKQTFFSAGVGPNVGWTLVTKFPNRDGFNGLSDHPVMRYSDVY